MRSFFGFSETNGTCEELGLRQLKIVPPTQSQFSVLIITALMIGTILLFQFFQPAFAAPGDYVLPYIGNQVFVVDRLTGTSSIVQSQLGEPNIVAIDSDGNYVVGNGRDLLSVTPAGEISEIASFSSLGLGTVNGITIDSSGNYILTAGSSLVSLTPTGQLTTIASGLNSLRDVAIDSNGNYIVIEGGAPGRILSISPSGVASFIANVGTDPRGLAIESNGDYIETDGDGWVRLVTPGGSVTRIANINSPVGVATDLDGDIIVTSRNLRTLLSIDPITFAQTTIASGLGRPGSVDVDSFGNYIIANTGGNLLSVTPAGEVSVVASGLGLQPTRVAVDSSGNYIISNLYGTLVSMTPSGEVTSIAHTLGSAYSVAIDSSGNYVVGNAELGKLYYVTTSGDVSLIRDGVFAYDIAIDSDGNYVIADNNGRKIVRVTPLGDLTTIFSAFGTNQYHEPYQPKAITIDSAGNYVVLFTDQSQSYYGILSITQAGDSSTILPQTDGLRDATGIAQNGCGGYVVSTRTMGLASVSPSGAVNIIAEVKGLDVAIEPGTIDNLPPTANAGTDQIVDEGTAGVTLVGSESTDPGCTIASYAWSQIAGPSVSLTGDGTASPTFDAPSVTTDTTLTFKLIVTDDQNAASSPSFVNVLVKNVPTDDSVLTLNAIGKTAWGKSITVSGTLKDSTTNKVIAAATITFTGTQASGLPASATTDSKGAFTATALAPSAVGSWQVTAHYSGYDFHKPADSTTVTYDTLKHKVAMSLTISPSTMHVRQPYSVTVTLVDTDAGSAGIASKTITFKATSPITIPSGTTNGSGVYTVSGLLAPPSKGYYDIKASFAGDSLYSSGSATKTLRVN